MFVLDYFLIFHCHHIMHTLESSGKKGRCLLHIFTEVWEDETVSYMTFKTFYFFLLYFCIWFRYQPVPKNVFSSNIGFSSSKSLLCYVVVCLPCDRHICLTQNTYFSLLSSGLLYTSLQRNSNKNLTKTEDKKNHFLVPDYRMTSWIQTTGRFVVIQSWVKQNKS